jgi:hypothetical protein
MTRLAGLMGVSALWLTVECAECERPFDVRVDLAALPVKPAGPGFPEATAGGCRLRVPTGGDQESIALLEPGDVRAELVARCVIAGEAPGLDACEAALEAVSPEVSREVSTHCPACGVSALVPVDHYAGLRRESGHLEEDVHVLACVYGWTEGDVLALPADRRRRYVARAQRELEPA